MFKTLRAILAAIKLGREIAKHRQAEIAREAIKEAGADDNRDLRQWSVTGLLHGDRATMHVVARSKNDAEMYALYALWDISSGVDNPQWPASHLPVKGVCAVEE